MVSMIVYSLLGTWLLYTFPQSFTLGEAMIVSQGITIMLLDTGLQLFDTVSYSHTHTLLLFTIHIHISYQVTSIVFHVRLL